MSALWQVGVPAMIGLLGTLVGLFIGHRKWSVEHRLSLRRAHDAKRHAAYERLWQLVETSHVELRTSMPTPAEVARLKQEINKFRMENAIYVDDADSQLASSYFEAAVSLGEKVAASGCAEWKERYELTIEPNEIDETVKQQNTLANEVSRVSDIRNRLIVRVREELLKTSYAVAA